ncbi:hypothetical protein [Pseudomonas sp. MWU349]|uniref:hypothetical protein n=1 Tax=Pseudomonas sp. MWU349 TaxID=2802572 RepID=UPI001FF0B6BB|nr:hypothetical protein [Pseudomonas sp. MWU349]
MIKSGAVVLLDASDEPVAGQIRTSLQGAGGDCQCGGPGLAQCRDRACLATLPGLSHQTLEWRSVCSRAPQVVPGRYSSSSE